MKTNLPLSWLCIRCTDKCRAQKISNKGATCAGNHCRQSAVLDLMTLRKAETNLTPSKGTGKGSSKTFLLKAYWSYSHFDKPKTPASSFQNSELTYWELRLRACFKESDPVSSHMNDWLCRLWDFHTITLHHQGLIYSVATATPKCVSSLSW